MLPFGKMLAGNSNHFYRHSAIVEVNGKIVGSGFNFNNRHAEAGAIADALTRVKSVVGASVWSLRFTKTGKLSTANPCPTCHAFLKSLGIKTVYYSDVNGGVQKMRL